MRFPKLRRRLIHIAIALTAALALLYGFDFAFVHYRNQPFADVRVDSMYAMKNRWNEVEYSVGSTGTERCVEALFPHFGYNPCWYVNSHAMHYIRIGW